MRCAKTCISLQNGSRLRLHNPPTPTLRGGRRGGFTPRIQETASDPPPPLHDPTPSAAVGIDLTAWYNDMPRMKRNRYFVPTLMASHAGGAGGAAPAPAAKRRTIDAYYQSLDCFACGQPNVTTTTPAPPLCDACLRRPAATLLTLTRRTQFLEREQRRLWGACGECSGCRAPQLADECVALDCYLPFQKKNVALGLAQSRWVLQYVADGPRKGPK